MRQLAWDPSWPVLWAVVNLNLKATLALLFAVTTPVGILVGLVWYGDVGGPEGVFTSFLPLLVRSFISDALAHGQRTSVSRKA
jgi:hypothetical protein